MTLYQTHRSDSSNMRLLQHFGSILLCLAVVSSQNRDSMKLNEIERNPKNSQDDIISEKDYEKAASVVSISIKEIKPKEREYNLEALSTNEQKSVIRQKNSSISAKFGQRSSKVKEVEKTEASHRGEQYLPNPKVSNARTIPEFENAGRAQITHRNVPAYERYPDSGRQEKIREGTPSRQPLHNAKRMEHAEVRSFSEPPVLHRDSEDYDDSRMSPRSKVLVSQTHPRQRKAEDFDVSYDEVDDECSKSRSKSVSQEDGSSDRHPRQSRFRHRIQSIDARPHYRQHADDYSYRPQNADGARSFGSNERAEEDDEFIGRERRPNGHERHYYNNRDMPPQQVQRHHGQHLQRQIPQGKDSSVSNHKDSVSKSLSVSKSYSEPKKTTKVVFYEKPNSNQRVPLVYQTTPTYVEDQLPYQEQSTHHQTNGPVSQNPPPREHLRGGRHSSDNPPRKPLTQHGHGRPPAHEYPGSQQYERSHPQTQYSNENNRDHHAEQIDHPHSAPDQQYPPLPRHNHHHHHHPHSHAQHQYPLHANLQEEQSNVDSQLPPESRNQRQDLVYQPQHRQQATNLRSSLRESRNQIAPQINQNYDHRNLPYTVDPGQTRNAAEPNYNSDYTGRINNQYHGEEIVQPHKNVEPPKSPTHRDSPASYYPVQDSGVRQHLPRSGPEESPRLPQPGGEPRPYVSVSYSESSYKDGEADGHRYSNEKTPYYREHERNPEYYKQELPLSGYAKTPVPDQFEKTGNGPNITPEKSHGPNVSPEKSHSPRQYQYPQKSRDHDESYPANQNSDYGYQNEPPAEEHQRPRDEYESDPPEQEETPHSVLSHSFLRNHPDISDKAKIIVAEPVPGKPGVLVADGARAVIAGNMRGKSTPPHSTPTDSESPQVSYKPVAAAANPDRERNYGITQNIPGSFAALVNTDPKFLRNLPEMMHSHTREPSGGGAPDSDAYYSRQQDTSSKETDSGRNYEIKNYNSQPYSPPDVNNYGTAHGIIQDHGDGVRSMMYHIRPNRKKFSPSTEESRTSERKQKHPGSMSERRVSKKSHAKNDMVDKTPEFHNQSDKRDKKTTISAK